LTAEERLEILRGWFSGSVLYTQNRAGVTARGASVTRNVGRACAWDRGVTWPLAGGRPRRCGLRTRVRASTPSNRSESEIRNPTRDHSRVRVVGSSGSRVPDTHPRYDFQSQRPCPDFVQPRIVSRLRATRILYSLGSTKYQSPAISSIFESTAAIDSGSQPGAITVSVPTKTKSPRQPRRLQPVSSRAALNTGV